MTDQLHWAGCAHGEPATWDLKAVVGAENRCTSCICDNRFLWAALTQTARAGLGVVQDAAHWLSSKLAAWLVETRHSLDKPAPPEPPCQATLNTGGFALLCAWSAHPGPEHMDPAYGVWSAHGSGAPQ